MAKQAEDIQLIKQRFGIIGNSVDLNRDIEIALAVAPTDLSVLILGESGVGKRKFSPDHSSGEFEKTWILYSSQLWINS